MALHSRFLSVLLMLSPYASASTEEFAEHAVQALAALSKSATIGDRSTLETALGSPLVEIDPKNSQSLPELVTTNNTTEGTYFKPSLKGTGVSLIVVSRQSGGRQEVSIHLDPQICVAPSRLQEVLSVKAKFLGPPPLHGVPQNFHPDFWPLTHWRLDISHAQPVAGTATGPPTRRGVRMHFMMPKERTLCVDEIYLQYRSTL
jgi:hypothetical protein